MYKSARTQVLVNVIGDIIGQPMLAHKAVHEGHVADEVIASELQGNKELASAAFNARVIPSVAYTDPEVAWVGLTETEAKAQGIKIKKSLFPWSASGRAIANGRDEGVTKLLFGDSPEAHGHGKILGGGMVGTHAGGTIGVGTIRGTIRGQTLIKLFRTHDRQHFVQRPQTWRFWYGRWRVGAGGTQSGRAGRWPRRGAGSHRSGRDASRRCVRDSHAGWWRLRLALKRGRRASLLAAGCE